MRPVAPPDGIRAADLGSVIVIVNYLTGGHYTLSGQAGDLWRALATTGDADTAALGIDIVNQLMRCGLLAEVSAAQPGPPLPVTSSTASGGTIERDACLPRLPPPPHRWRTLGRSLCWPRSPYGKPDGRAAASRASSPCYASPRATVNQQVSSKHCLR